MITYGPIQSGSSDRFSGISQIINDSSKHKELLYCDPQGNRGFMLTGDYGIVFTKEGKTVAITFQANYEYDPEQWAFKAILTSMITGTLSLPLDEIARVHRDFSDPCANITIVENVEKHLFTIISDNRFITLNSVSRASDLKLEEEMANLVRVLENDLTTTLFKQIPTTGNYSD